MNKCNHEVNDKNTSIFVDKKRWFGIKPMVCKGICRCCGKNFEFIKEGEKLIEPKK